jgi:hypothetical protein
LSREELGIVYHGFGEEGRRNKMSAAMQHAALKREKAFQNHS